MVGPPFLVTFLFMICLIMIPLAVAETPNYTWERGTPWSDGTDGVTQCPILPGENYTYEFVVDKAGTYMYHSHYGMQREAGLYGLIIVSLPAGESEPFSYDHDHDREHDHGITLSDWYHHSAYDHATRLSSKPFEWIGEPQSLLINDRGKYNCTGIHPSVCNSSLPQCSPFALTDHMMKAVEADENFVEPFLVENLYIYSGETYSVLSVANNRNAISRTGIYKLEFGSTVDIILQNANTMKNETSETHPWHLHGHDFRVLGYGEGKFNLKTDVNKYNLVNPIMKNTVLLHPHGWTAVRFKADSPDVWLFHCHIEAHFFMGCLWCLRLEWRKVGDMPKSNLGCGKSKYLIAP
ncbi:hypothetical protein SLEP1_g34782 [Rubroshorea leprosula]|uniref:L-ascorbate oxidase n=1 Tax=Rubroshorea leprosula TaxID=152421 RepID=A0AAV5KL43_9ROSI|nr:hypothetical protein SLEP1_g34782 [Rubroshorea leprosula]